MEHEGEEQYAPESQSLDSVVSGATEDSQLGTSSETSDTELKEVLSKKKRKGKYPKSWMRESEKVKNKYKRSGKASLKGILCHNCLELGHFTKDCPEQEREIKTVSKPLEASPAQVKQALQELFNQDTFFPGQEDTIMKIISGTPTLSVLPMDCDKSTCYLLPAYLYSKSSSCITLVVSPQISLMKDQVEHLPSQVRGACLHNNQTLTECKKVLRKVRSGEVHVLLLTPEAFESYKYWQFPPIAFVCIDDFHSISEWGHFFRPSFLRISKVLQQLGIQCTLALSNTATKSSAYSLANQLTIAKENVIFHFRIPGSLHVSVSTTSHHTNRDRELVGLLETLEKKGCDSVKIYCQSTAKLERIKKLLEKQGADGEDEDESSCPSGAKKQKLDSSLVGKYSSRVSTGERDALQSHFMKGSLSIMVTTVASGSGLRTRGQCQAIVYYNMPQSYELFMYAVGQATYCHVFVDEKKKDAENLTSLIEKNTPKLATIQLLVNHIKQELDGKQTLPEAGTSYLVTLPSADQKSLATLMCCLEMDGVLEMMGPISQGSCRIRSTGFSEQTPQQIYNKLYLQCGNHEKSHCKKLDDFHQDLQLVARRNHHLCFQEDNTSRERKLKSFICNYFHPDRDEESQLEVTVQAPSQIPAMPRHGDQQTLLSSQQSGGDLPSTSDLETAGQDTPRVGSQFSSTGSFMEASTTSTEISDGITNLPSRSASPPDQDGQTIELSTLVEKLHEARAKWYNIGLQLHLEPGTLKAIEEQFRNDPQNCLREVLNYWLNMNADCTWNALAKVLRKPTVGEIQIAEGLEAKYCSFLNGNRPSDPLPFKPPVTSSLSSGIGSSEACSLPSSDEDALQESMMSLQQQSSHSQTLDESDLPDIVDYLHPLTSNKTKIYDLAIFLGLKQEMMKQCLTDSSIHPPAFLDDVIRLWLQQGDNVTKKSSPGWGSLVKALKRKRMAPEGTQIAEDIKHI